MNAPDPSDFVLRDRGPVGALRRAAVSAMLAVIWLYQRGVSQTLHAVAGPSCGCRFHPTCSDYAAEALRVHGPVAGLYLAVRRILRCTPVSAGGVDFVPEPHALRRTCVRTLPSRPAL